MSNYKPTIGIEVHVELKTNSKAFSYTANDYNSSSNTNINEIDLGYPGVLPCVNREIINDGLIASLALHCSINEKMHFDRKNYFYPDLPKGYQITQARTPIGHDGYIKLSSGKIMGIERLHIEEDTAKSLHSKNKTLLNYNRAGVPLIEIVSCPDISSGDEAMEYLERLREILLYTGVSDCKIEEGSMRADVNVSISDSDILGTKCEVKNIGSISNVGLAIDYEIKRQTEILTNGGKIDEETRKFDSSNNTTVLMRKKEIGNDYRYFPEPDIPYVLLDDDWVNSAKESLVMLPDQRREVYNNLGISDVNIDKLIANKELSDYLNGLLDSDIDFTIASNILLGDISNYLNKEKVSINNTHLNLEKFITLVNKLKKDEISSKIFKEIINDLMENDLSIDEVLKNKGIVLINDTDSLKEIILDVLEKYSDSVNDYKNGKENAFKFLMGMVMKETHGNANPKLVNSLLSDLLSN